MRKVLLRSRVLLLVLCVAALMLAGCGHIRRAAEPPHGCPGGSGSTDKAFPFICIDDSTLSPHPEIAYVWDRQPQRNGEPSTHPVMIKWATKSGGGRLGIEFAEKGCLEPNSLRCNGHGFCFALTRKVEKGQVSCSYSINLEGRQRDPEVVVQPCCMAEAIDNPNP